MVKKPAVKEDQAPTWFKQFLAALAGSGQPAHTKDLVVDDLAKQLHAAQAVLKAHGVEWDASKADLSKLAFKDGAVSGEYAYQKPSGDAPKGDTPSAQQQQKQGNPFEAFMEMASQSQANPLTLADVEKMSETEINKRWEEVSPLLAQGGVA